MSQPSGSVEGNPPIFNAPRVVVWLIGSFVLIHLYQLMMEPIEAMRFVIRFAFIPARYGVAEDGVLYEFPDGTAGDLWTWVSYIFLHGDWIHLFFNSFWLLAMGTPIAQRLQPARFILFFLVCGAAGAGIHLLTHDGSIVPTIGASASVSGLMGAVGVFSLGVQRFGEARGAGTKRMLSFIAVYVIMNVVIGSAGFDMFGEVRSIAWEAHLGGFFAGILLFPFFVVLFRGNRHPRQDRGSSQ